MKRRSLLLSLVAGFTYLALSGYGSGPYQGGAGNRTGSANSTAGCTSSGCHSAATGNTTLTIGLVDPAAPTVPITKYIPGKLYTVVLAGNNTTLLPKFGFQASAVKAAATSTQSGTFAIGTATGIAVRNAGSLQLVEHTTPQTGITPGTYVKQFNWTAPASGTGTVRFFVALNAVNGNGNESGDQPNFTTWDIQESAVSVANASHDLHLRAYPNPAAGTLHLDLNGAAAGAYTLTVYNLSGQPVIHREWMVSSAAASLSLDVQSWAAGLYQLRISGSDASQVLSFIKE